MKIIHHNDDDGRCAAAIVGLLLIDDFRSVIRTDYIEYSYNGDLDISSINDNENVYIVDLSLSQMLLDKIKELKSRGCNIVYIDHHQTTIDIINSLEPEDAAFINTLKGFRMVGVSGSLLTWVYSCLSDDERKSTPNVDFDFSEGKTHVKIAGVKEYKIPDVIRFVDDHDIWTHSIPDTKYFNTAFRMERDKHPSNKIWRELMFGPIGGLYKYVDNGKLLLQYQESVNNDTTYNRLCFEHTLYPDTKILCVNGIGNSSVFGDRYEDYDMCVLFTYTRDKKWKYSFYSSEKRENPINCAEFAKNLDPSGGGHIHAAGVMLNYFIFHDNPIALADLCEFGTIDLKFINNTSISLNKDN